MTIEVQFTSLPTVSNATMSDIICAVQGYINPSNLGISVQENLQQVYNLFQSNIILYNAGNPNGAVAGTTYQFCWDTLDSLLFICTTSGNAATAVWTVATGSGSAFVAVAGTSQQMVINTTYQTTNSSLTTLTLPTTSVTGTRLNVTGLGSGGWTIAQNSGQNIRIGNTVSTTGTGGSASSSNRYDGISLICTVANTTWQTMVGPQGMITIV